MNQRILCLALSLLAMALHLPAQTDSATAKLYFDTGDRNLRADAVHSLQALLDSVPIARVERVRCTGFADNVGNAAFNKQLALQRAEAAAAWLRAAGLSPSAKVDVASYGMDAPLGDNKTAAGRQLNRRVEVVLLWAKPRSIPVVTSQVAIEVAPPPLPPVDPDPDCKRDTVIVLPKGTRMVFNRCEFIRLQPCLEFYEAVDPPSILVNGLATQDTSGIPLATCGMTRVTMRAGCTDRPCFKFPVLVRFPVEKDQECLPCRRSGFGVYAIARGGGWALDKGGTIKVVKVDGRDYYQFPMKCPNYWFNCDCKMSYTKLKVKAPKGVAAGNLRLRSDCPVFVLKPKVKDRRPHVAVFKVPQVKSELFLEATGSSVAGLNPGSGGVRLNGLSHSYAGEDALQGKDKRRLKPWLGVFPRKAKTIYKRYFLQPSGRKLKKPVG